MFQNIYVPVDNSPHSDAAVRLALSIAKASGAKLYGSHVYAAKLHDKRFRTMESGLPEEFQQEKELQKQRVIHDSLITKGLELITDSYLLVMAEACREAGLEFKGISLFRKICNRRTVINSEVLPFGITDRAFFRTFLVVNVLTRRAFKRQFKGFVVFEFCFRFF